MLMFLNHIIFVDIFHNFDDMTYVIDLHLRAV